jgi:transcriptional regulator with XRE-family HTH domain
MPRFTKSAAADLERFGQALREARTAEGLSQAELARALGLKGQSTVSGWEAGTTEPEREHVFRLEDVLNQPAGKLSSILGYGPPVFDDSGRVKRAPTPSIRRAIAADDTLSKQAKDALMATYRAFASRSPACTTADRSLVAA